jgi:hypothetical protein
MLKTREVGLSMVVGQHCQKRPCGYLRILESGNRSGDAASFVTLTEGTQVAAVGAQIHLHVWPSMLSNARRFCVRSRGCVVAYC